MLSPRRLTLLLGLVPLLVLLLAYLPLLAGGQALYYMDLLPYVYPTQRLVAADLLAGALPGWNPYTYGGCALLAHGDTGAFYPLALLLVVGDPLVVYPWYLLLHQVLAFGGLLLLARSLRCSRGAAIVGATAFALTGLLVANHAFPRLFIGAVWMPWVLAGVVRVLRGERRALLWGGGCAALQLLAGGVESAYLTGIAAGIYALAVGTSSRKGLRGRARALGWVGALFALATALAAVQLLPLLEWTATSSRAGGPTLDANGWSLDLRRLVELAVPSVFGVVEPTRTFAAPSPLLRGAETFPWHTTIYAGGLVLVLATAGLTRLRRSPAVIAFATFGLLSVLVATGGNYAVGRALRSLLPGTTLFRFPEKMLVGLPLALSILTAFGVDAIAARSELRRRTAVAAASLAVAVIGLAMSPTLFGVELPAGRPAAAAPTFAVLLIAFAALGSRRLSPARLKIVLAVLVAFDLGLHERRHLYGIPRDAVPTTPWVAKVIGPEPLSAPAPRLWRIPSDRAFRVPPPLQASAHTRALHQVQSLFANSFVPHGQRLWGFAPGRLEVFDRFWKRYRGDRGALFNFLGVRYVLTEQDATPSAEGVRPLALNPDYRLALYERPGARPRATLVGDLRGAADLAGVFATLNDPEFRVDRQAVLLSETPLPSVVEPGETRCEVTSYRGSEVVVEVDSASGGAVVLADVYDAGWSATVDGEPSEVLLTNGLVRAVVVGSGAHEVVFAYEPPGLRLGASITLLALLAGALGWWRSGKAPHLDDPVARGRVPPG